MGRGLNILVWLPWLFMALIFVRSGNSVEIYDFIIVGAGAGGGVVARRLAEHGAFKVLLIESGGMPRQGYEVPALAQGFLNDPGVTFNFQTVPQKGAALRTNGVVSIVGGRMMGGSTSLNYNWFSRGSPRDWDNWALVTGDPSWSYQSMLKYFKKMENYEGDFPSVEHGYGGPLTISRQKYAPGLGHWLRAGKELGYLVGDPSGPQIPGFSPVEFSRKFGRRVSSFNGYLQPILDRSNNLHILADTNVTQIIFKGNRAVGVYYTSEVKNRSLYNSVYATKEVIISAGPYFSPTILQRSGIGPRDILQSANIPIVKELPTGQNFQDHPSVNLHFIINNASAVFDEDCDLTPESWQTFNTYGDGPYTSVRGATGQAFLVSSVSSSEGNHDWADIQLCMSHSTKPYVVAEDLDMSVTSRLQPGEIPMSSSIFLGRPRSRGTVRINPANVFGDPLIDVGYLTNPKDVQIFFDGIKETLKIYEHTLAYKELQPRFAPPILPGCQQFILRSPEYWLCYIGQNVQGGTHASGTNKMGSINDPTAVVDSELRVIGIEGLRVADASIMPFVVNANPQASVYAIGEKASDLILKQWGLTSNIQKIKPLVQEICKYVIPETQNNIIPEYHPYDNPSNDFDKQYEQTRKLHEKLFLGL